MAERAVSSRATRKRTSPKIRTVCFDNRTLAKIRWCRRRLLAWYVVHGREFPWRSPSANLYQKIVVEILLQRTQASTIGQFCQQFFRHFGSWSDIHRAPDASLETILRPIGLWRRRTTALKALAREMVARSSSLPTERHELEALPAVGQYVANAIMLFAHGRPMPLLDADMARVLERAFKPHKLADIRYDPELQALASTLVKSTRSIEVNWAVLDVAARYCRSKQPFCVECPIQLKCNYRRSRI
jgi:A/G-specific adenine glycosylase